MKFTFSDLTLEETNLVLSALGKLPIEIALELWAKLKKSAEDQIKEQQSET